LAIYFATTGISNDFAAHGACSQEQATYAHSAACAILGPWIETSGAPHAIDRRAPIHPWAFIVTLRPAPRPVVRSRSSATE